MSAELAVTQRIANLRNLFLRNLFELLIPRVHATGQNEVVDSMDRPDEAVQNAMAHHEFRRPDCTRVCDPAALARARTCATRGLSHVGHRVGSGQGHRVRPGQFPAHPLRIPGSCNAADVTSTPGAQAAHR